MSTSNLVRLSLFLVYCYEVVLGKIERVILIGIDGLEVEELKEAMQSGRAPNLVKLQNEYVRLGLPPLYQRDERPQTDLSIMDNYILNSDNMIYRGAYTFDARATWPTDSFPNWITILASQSPEFSGVHGNDYRLHAPMVPNANGPCKYYATFFRVLRELYPYANLASFYDWGGLDFILTGSSLNVQQSMRTDKDVIDNALEYYKSKEPLASFVYFVEADDEGHRHGFGERYSQAIETTDRYIGKLLSLLRERNMLDTTAIFIVSDHGRDPSGRRHGGFTAREIRVPWIAWSPGNIKPGLISRSVSTLDTSPTILRALGHNVNVPQWRGVAINDIFVEQEELPKESVKVDVVTNNGCLSKYTIVTNFKEEILTALYLRPFSPRQFAVGIILGMLSLVALQIVCLVSLRVLRKLWWFTVSHRRFVRYTPLPV